MTFRSGPNRLPKFFKPPLQMFSSMLAYTLIVNKEPGYANRSCKRVAFWVQEHR